MTTNIAIASLLSDKLAGEEILVIGDTPLDIACARAIQAKVLAVATGNFTTAELSLHNPDWVADTLEGVDLKELCQL
jgi:phosphoglycolate phosphatase